MPGFDEFLLSSGVGIIGFFGGRFWERKDQREKFVNEKINKLSTDVTSISNSAANYYVRAMDERTTAAETALIGGAFKRLNVDLHSLCQCAKICDSEFIDVLTAFHSAVTSEPFGSNVIPPMAATDPRVLAIQDAEERFIRKLRYYEKI
jgi:hypothetical protein